MRQATAMSRTIQCNLRTALGPGTQAIGVTEAILRMVSCPHPDPSQPVHTRYCETPSATLDRHRRRPM